MGNLFQHFQQADNCEQWGNSHHAAAKLNPSCQREEKPKNNMQPAELVALIRSCFSLTGSSFNLQNSAAFNRITQNTLMLPKYSKSCLAEMWTECNPVQDRLLIISHQSGTCDHDSWLMNAFSLLFLLLNPRQLAESHYNLFLLRRCALGWHQSVKVSLTQNRASADQLYHHSLLRRSLSCWKGVCIHKHTHTQLNTSAMFPSSAWESISLF